MMEHEKVPSKTVAITSGKGGVGKTNLATNLALCFAASNKKVLLLDADLGLGNVDVIMNTESKFNLLHVINGSKTLEEVITVGPGGVELICGASGIEDVANLTQFHMQRLLDDLDKLQKSADMIIIDTGAGINSSIVSFCMASDEVLVVTTPEPAAMTDAYAMIKVLSLREYDGKINLAVNMASSVTEGKQVHRQLADVAMRFLKMPVYEAGILCKSDHLLNSIRQRKPVVLNYPKSKITSSIVSMASRLGKTSPNKQQDDSFFRKVCSIFSKHQKVIGR